MKSRPTIHDVARAAGVSITTVSHALNGKGHVAEQTRDRITGVAQRLGYVANPLARGFRAQSLHVLGLVIRPFEQLSTYQPDGVDYYARIVGETSSRALEHGYGTMLLDPRHNPTSDSLVRAFDGFVIDQPIESDPLLSILLEREIPVATIGRDVSRPEFPHAVDDHDFLQTTLLIEHLVAMGTNSLWYIGGTAGDSWNADVMLALEQARQRSGLTVTTQRCPESLGVEGGFMTMRQLLAEHATLPDAVLCLTGRQSGGAEQALLEAGVSIPDQVMLASCIDAEQCRQAPVPITTVYSSARAAARAAVDRVISQIRGVAFEKAPTIASIIPRASTARGIA